MKSTPLSVPVTGYVHQFLLRTVGPGPYDLNHGHLYPREMFLSLAWLWQRSSNIFYTKTIEIDLGKSPMLHSNHKVIKDKLERGLFGLHQFYQQLFLQVNMSVTIKDGMGYKKGTKSNRIISAVEEFLERYEIDEDTYSLDAAYMQYMRMKRHYPSLVKSKA